MEEGSDSNGIVETTGGNLSPEAWAKEHIEELERPMPHVQLEPNDLVLSPIETNTIDEEANSVSGEARANGVMANSDSSDDEQQNNTKQPLKSDNKLEECNKSSESEDDDGEEPYVPNNDDESESEDGEPSLTAQSPTKSRNELKKETLQIRSKILSK